MHPGDLIGAVVAGVLTFLGGVWPQMVRLADRGSYVALAVMSGLVATGIVYWLAVVWS